MSIYAACACGRCGARVWSTDSSGQCGRCKAGLNNDLQDCGICLGPVQDRVRYAKIDNESWNNERCKHSGNFCRACLQQYLRSQLSDGCWNIRCPSVRCQYLLVEADMERILSVGASEEAGVPDKKECNMLLERYTMLRTGDYGSHLRAVLGIHKVEISAPADDHTNVSASTSSDSSDVSESSDSEVSTPSLAVANESCMQAGFGTWASESCQACPRCLVIIRKETGCDHIQCRCGSSFCYGCGAPQGTSPNACMCSGGKGPILARWLRRTGRLSMNTTSVV